MFEILGSGTLGYLTSNKSAIILNQECGTSCSFLVILPIEGNIEHIYYNPQAINLENNLIAYSPTSFKDSVFLIVENYINHKHINIYENNVCNSTFKGDCIECCYFNKEELVIVWDGKNWKSSNNPDIKKKLIKIPDSVLYLKVK